MATLRVLHILNTSTFSGAENVVCQIISLFKTNLKYDMAYCSLNGSIQQTLKEKQIKFFPINQMSILEVRKVICNYRPDIIHTHDVKASVVAAICHGNTKLISTIHGNDIRMRSLNAKSLCSLLIMKEANHIFWVSDSCLREYRFRNLSKSKSSVLYNVLDENELNKKVKQDTADYKYEVIYIGRLSPEKNPMRLLDVLCIVLKNDVGIKVGIVGTGELEPVVRQRITESGLEDRIILLGYKTNPLKVLADSRVLVMTSDWEGTPMVVLEAMALGIPVVSTPTDGIKELIINDVNGYLANDNKVLAQKIVDYIKDQEKWNILSANTRKIFHQKNDITLFMKMLDKYYSA